MEQLVELLGRGYVLEQVFTQVENCGLGGKGGDADHLWGQQNLPAPCCGHDPRRAVHRWPKIVPIRGTR